MRESGGGFAHEFGDANRSGGSPGGGPGGEGLLLVLMVLLQRSRSDGLGTLSGGALEATLGPNAAGVLRGATAWMGVAFLINSLLLTALM